MMKTRSAFILLSALLLLAAGLIWMIDPWSTTGDGISAMLPGDPDQVTEVQVVSGYDTLQFFRSDSSWIMEGEVMNPDAVDNLVYAASRLSMRSILTPDAAKDAEPAVELLFRKGKRVAGHFFFAPAKSGYMIYAPGAGEVYGVELPGYSALALEKIFSGNADHYRMHLLADLLPSEIASVEVRPWKGTGFTALQDSVYDLQVLEAGSGEDVTATLDEHKVRMLFSYFNAIRYSRVAPATEVQEGLEPGKPWASVVVTTFDGVRRKFDVFQWVRPGTVAPDLFEALVVFNDRPLLLVVNYVYLDLLVRGLEAYR